MQQNGERLHNRFLNCLRIAVVPGYYEEQRTESIIKFCKKYNFDNVMLFINAEEYCVGHMTKTEAADWLAAMKRAKKKLCDAGITVSLNQWMELGHLDRGRTLKDGQNFVTMTDYNGKRCKLCACPMDENWLNYFLDFYEFLIRELEPDTVWIEDDFRLHNHAPLEYGGCFCEHHMKAFNAELGTDYTREEFIDRLFGKNPQVDVKKAFMEVNRRCMRELAEKIGNAVKNIGLGTKIGLMSSMHTAHSMEYRDWYGIHNGFAQGGTKINRLHLPMYLEEISLKKYYQQFNHFSFICRGFLPEDCRVMPELENAVFSTYAKDAEALRFQVESAMPLEIDGMTYDIFDFTGNGAVEKFGYGEELLSIFDYMDAVMKSGYSYRDLKGVVIPLDEKNGYNRPINNSFWDLQPDDTAFATVIQAHGISARCSKEKQFNGEIIVLGGGALYNFTDEQIIDIFNNNKVILDGTTVTLLAERGLAHLIGVESFKIYSQDADIHSYEQVEGDTLVNGIPGYRASAFSLTGDFVAVKYANKPDVKSRVYDYLGNELAAGITVSNGHLVVPYVVRYFQANQLHPLRQKLVCDYIDTLDNEIVRADYSSVYSYYSKSQDKNVLILVNSTLHTLPTTRFKICNYKIKEIYEISRTGEHVKKQFTTDDEGFTVIDEPFAQTVTKTFIIK